MDPGTQTGSLKSVTLHLSVLFSHVGIISGRYFPHGGQGSHWKPHTYIPPRGEEDTSFLIVPAKALRRAPVGLAGAPFPIPEPVAALCLVGVAGSAWPLLGHPINLGNGVSLTQTTRSKRRRGVVPKGNLRGCVWKMGESCWTGKKNRCPPHSPGPQGTPQAAASEHKATCDYAGSAESGHVLQEGTGQSGEGVAALFHPVQPSPRGCLVILVTQLQERCNHGQQDS